MDRDERIAHRQAGAEAVTGCVGQVLQYGFLGCLVMAAIPCVLVGGCLMLMAPAVNQAREAAKRAEAERIAEEQQQAARNQNPAPIQPPQEIVAGDNQQAVQPLPHTPPAEAPQANAEPAAPLPTYAVAKSRKAGEPLYIRATIPLGQHSTAEIIDFASRMASENGDHAYTVVDFFDTDGPLTWSGAFSVSKSAHIHWLCRVSMKNGESTLELATDPKTNKPKSGVIREQ